VSDRYFTYKTLLNEHILEKVRGVIHVGANYGQERLVYERHTLSVLWFEPIPWVFTELYRNVSQLIGQRAYDCAAWDKDELVHLHVTDNEGQSSSTFELGKHSEIWPAVHEDSCIDVPATRLDSFFSDALLDAREFDFLVIDAQGAELKVLQGAEGIIGAMKYVQVETTDCELYKGCAKLSEIESFMQEHGFKEIERTAFSPRPDIGQCYELLYARAE
jgi:FkbM family methyltransferase